MYFTAARHLVEIWPQFRAAEPIFKHQNQIMKKLLLLAAIFQATVSFSQVSASNTTNTSPRIIFADSIAEHKMPAYFINGKFMQQLNFLAFNPDQIADLNIVKQDISVDGIQYYGQVHIKTKAGYNPKLISFADLKSKYFRLKNQASLFMIDGQIVKGEYNKWEIDEDNILSITLETVKNPGEKIDFVLLKILTKSQENIRKANEIRIRGTEMALTKQEYERQ